MPAARTPQERWIQEGFRALAAGGPDAVRVEGLARAIGVTKGGFYWHFADRGALLEAMLDAWEDLAIDQAIAHAEAEGGDARAKLGRLFALAATSGDLLGADLAIRDWARRDKTVAKRLRRVDNRRMAYLRALFGQVCDDEADAEARSVLAMALFIGSHFMAADLGAGGRAGALRRAAARLLA